MIIIIVFSILSSRKKWIISMKHHELLKLIFIMLLLINDVTKYHVTMKYNIWCWYKTRTLVDAKIHKNRQSSLKSYFLDIRHYKFTRKNVLVDYLDVFALQRWCILNYWCNRFNTDKKMQTQLCYDFDKKRSKFRSIGPDV